ncbi:baculoviral IAP repeat-containing protein 2-like [Gigantopelta aegis]|uniref:baculoviral IAP repeat-containing protein 2-like n=1 Tax=Gigantopelta aegis TaxID=1735272 RepID=UPI001B889798|nr:baculoviral IAP repeat-containing protein 2-like [Gigantopelta aegis]
MDTREHIEIVDEERMDQTDVVREYKTDSAAYNDAYDVDDEWDGFSRHYLFCHRPDMRGSYAFGRWPLQMSQSPRELAKNCFFYTGDHNAVACYCCGLRAYGWQKSDDSKMKHYRLYQKCPFIRRVSKLFL